MNASVSYHWILTFFFKWSINYFKFIVHLLYALSKVVMVQKWVETCQIPAWAPTHSTFFFLIWLSANVHSEKQWMNDSSNTLIPPLTCENRPSSQFLASIWLNPSYCGHSGSKPADRQYLWQHLVCFINTILFKQNINIFSQTVLIFQVAMIVRAGTMSHRKTSESKGKN